MLVLYFRHFLFCIHVVILTLTRSRKKLHGPYICFLNKTFSLLVLLSGGFLYAGAGLFLSIFLGFQFTFRLKDGRQHGVSWLLALQTTAACSTFTFTANLLENTICSINSKNSLQYIASFGDPGGIRTHGLSLRRRPLYPTELRNHIHILRCYGYFCHSIRADPITA